MNSYFFSGGGGGGGGGVCVRMCVVCVLSLIHI